MTQMKKYYKLILVFVIALTLMINANVVKAEEMKTCKQLFGSEAKLYSALNVSQSVDGNTFKFKFSPKTDDSKLKEGLNKAKIVVTEVYPNTSSNKSAIGKSAGAGSWLTVTLNDADDRGAGPEREVKVKIDLTSTGLCKGVATFNESTVYFVDNAEIEDEVVLPTITIDQTIVDQGKKIDCDKTYTENSFEERFCKAKKEALKKPKYSSSNNGDDVVNFEGLFPEDTKYPDVVGTETNKKGQTVTKTRKFKCNINLKKKMEEIDPKDEKKYYLDENTKYMYGSGETEITTGKYQFHYRNNEAKGDIVIKCTKVCEESVIVKYGPPVASKAGLCFTYKVKVESRTSCYMKEPGPTPVPVKNKVCIPFPKCYGHGRVYNQGGPDEEFDKCVNDCDEGKYTDKCTNKCYNEIYTQTRTNETIPLANFEKQANSSSMTPEKYAQLAKAGNAAKGYSGFYFEQKGNAGEPHWYTSSIGDGGGTKGIWYYKNSWGFAGHVYNVIKNGIPRTSVCTDYCRWYSTGCASDAYINYGLAEYDYEVNHKKYEEAVKKCKAQAICTNKTAEYTISASYVRPKDENGGTEEIWVDFPYTKKKDTLKTCKSNGSSTNTDKETTIIDFAGCYKDACDSGKYYMTEWSFPDAWQNKKTGEISLKPDHDGDSAWRKKTKKFCLPGDARTVNGLWYQWYTHKVEKQTDEEYDNVCLSQKSKEVIKHNDYSESLAGDSSKIDWNIVAETRNFGMFNWHINMKCFYAIDSGNSNETIDQDEKKKEECGVGYRVRTVANSDLFPSGSSSTVAGAAAPSTGGSNGTRDIGYNWTKESSIPSSVNPTYANDPEVVRTYVQAVGNTVYGENDAYLDYHFKLTPNDLQAIKQYNSLLGGKYDLYCGKIEEQPATLPGQEQTAIYAYHSNLFRGVKQSTEGCPSDVRTNIISAKKLGNPKCNHDAKSGSGTNRPCDTNYQK